MANNQNEKKTEGQQAVDQQVQQTPAQTGAPEGQQQIVETKTEEKLGFGGWLKKHWKGVTAAVVGVGTAVGTSIAAYKKGKAAGQACAPMPIQDQEDYSLNPNE